MSILMWISLIVLGGFLGGVVLYGFYLFLFSKHETPKNPQTTASQSERDKFADKV